MLMLVMILLVALTRPSLAKHDYIKIDPATITNVHKFVSRSGKTHLKFRLTAKRQTYPGIMFQGKWNTDSLSALRSGTVALYGYFNVYDKRYSFVATRVERR